MFFLEIFIGQKYPPLKMLKISEIRSYISFLYCDKMLRFCYVEVLIIL